VNYAQTMPKRPAKSLTEPRRTASQSLWVMDPEADASVSKQEDFEEERIRRAGINLEG